MGNRKGKIEIVAFPVLGQKEFRRRAACSPCNGCHSTAVVALALHNGAIIGHLIGRQSNLIVLRPDAPRGLDRYGFEILPRVYGQFLAFLFYRWEVIMRETAILGILGIQTLGFYVDSAIADIRTDRMIFLIGVTALLNIGVDAFSRNLRARLRLTTHAKVS